MTYLVFNSTFSIIKYNVINLFQKSSKLIFTFIVLFIFFNSVAQTGQISIGSGSTSEIFYNIKYDPSDGSTIQVGHVTNAATGNDGLIVKLNSSHQIVWQKVILNPGSDDIFNVTICSNGDYVITGMLVQSGKVRGFVSRINSANGNIIWTSTSSSTSSTDGDLYYQAIETVNNNIAIVGTNDYAPNHTNIMIVLLNSAGNQIWSKVSGFGLSDELTTIEQLPNNNLIVGGFHNNGGSYNMDLLELNELSGNIISQNTYSISTSIPGVPLNINSIWPSRIFIRNGNVVLSCIVFQNYSGDTFPAEYIYDQLTRNLTGNILYHPGATTGISFGFFPIASNDFILSYSSVNLGNTFISRVTNGTIIYDKKISGVNAATYSIDNFNNDICVAGYVNVISDMNAYLLYSDISLGTSSSNCTITNSNTLILQPSNLNGTISNTILLSPINSATSATINPGNTSYIVNDLCGCTTAIINSQPNSISVCENVNASFTVTATNTANYQWQQNSGTGWVNVTNNSIYSGATTNSLAIAGVSLLMNNIQYQCLVSNSCSNITTSPATLSVIAATTPTVTIAASANLICSGSNVTFTAIATNGGTAPVFQWTKNAINVGSNSPTYSDNTLNNGDIIKCILTSNLNCATPNPVTSNSIVISVTNTVSPSIVISASANPFCFGSAVTFTATPTNGGVTPIYQWIKNSINVGLNSPLYTDNSINNGDIIQCVLTSNADCITVSQATSNTITMVLASPVTPTINITTPMNPVCQGNIATFNAISTNGGSLPVYHWTKNGVDVGTNSSVYTDNSINSGDIIKCILVSNENCVTTNLAESNIITMSVTTGTVPNVRYPTVSTYYNEPITLIARTFPASSYLWLPATGLSNAQISNPIFTNTNQQEFNIHITLSNGCKVVDTLLVKVDLQGDIYFPSAFTPNGDQLNDIFRAKTYRNLASFELEIYNRYGEKVFSSKDFQDGWDGNYKGKQQPTAVFTWQCTYELIRGYKNYIKGNVILIR